MLGLIAAVVLAAAAAPVPLPSPAQPTLLPGIGATAERQRVSVLPPGATATDLEDVAVGLTSSGAVQSVVVDQRIRLHGTGDYVIVERGPARAAEVLGDGDPPTIKVGAVLYAGFLPPTGRLLSARLTLDPGYEQARLPVSVALTYQPAHGAAQPLGPDGKVPGPGTLRVRLINTTGTILGLAAADAPAARVAAALDLLRRSALHPGPRPPVVGDGLPGTITSSSPVSEAAASVPAPLRVTGTIVVRNGTAAVSTLAGGGTSGPAVDGILADTAAFSLAVSHAGTLALDLTAVPALDPRNLTPPGSFPSWARWAAAGPDEAARRDAVDRLELAAGEAAQIRAISPYLTTGLVGQVGTTFHLMLAPAARVAPAAVTEQLRPLRLTLVLAGGVLVLVSLEVLRRRL